MTALKRAVEAAETYSSLSWGVPLNRNDPAYGHHLHILTCEIIRAIRNPEADLLRQVAERIGIQPSTVELAFTRTIDAIVEGAK